MKASSSTRCALPASPTTNRPAWTPATESRHSSTHTLTDNTEDGTPIYLQGFVIWRYSVGYEKRTLLGGTDSCLCPSPADHHRAISHRKDGPANGNGYHH